METLASQTEIGVCRVQAVLGVSTEGVIPSHCGVRGITPRKILLLCAKSCNLSSAFLVGKWTISIGFNFRYSTSLPVIFANGVF